MIIAIPENLLLIGMCGFVYLIFAAQVGFGFPPFYEKGNMEEEVMLVVPFMFAIMAVAVAAIFIPYFFIAFGGVSVWCGLRIRGRVKERTNGPLPWLLNPLTIGAMNRWPMLLFDAWTLGNVALLGLILIIG